MKKFSIVLIALLLAVSAMPSFAHGHKGKCRGEHHQTCCRSDKHHGHGKYQCPVTSMLMKKSKFFLSNADQIGLNEEQVNKIKAIQMDTKKDAIRGKADMQIAFLDLEAKLHENPLDMKGLNEMADNFSTGMAAGLKKMIQRLADLKAILTPEQMEKAKKLWKKQK